MRSDTVSSSDRQQQRVLIGPLQVVDCQHHRPIGRGSRTPAGWRRGAAGAAHPPHRGQPQCEALAQHSGQVGHQFPEHAGERRRPADEVRPPTITLGRDGGLHGADDRAERISQRRVRCRRAVTTPPVGKYAVAPGDLHAKGLQERRLAHARSPAEQDASVRARVRPLPPRPGVGSSPDVGRPHGRRGRAPELSRRRSTLSVRAVRQPARRGRSEGEAHAGSLSNRNCPPHHIDGTVGRARDDEDPVGG